MIPQSQSRNHRSLAEQLEGQRQTLQCWSASEGQLTVCHSRTYPRSEVRTETLASFRPWLDAALRDETPELPAVSGYHRVASFHLKATVNENTELEFQVLVKVIGDARFADHPKGRILQGLVVPEPPVVVAWFNPALERHPELIAWLGDFEGCLARCWLDSMEPEGEL